MAFNQSGKGHCDPVFATKTLSSQDTVKTDTVTVKTQSCSCGRGGAKDKRRSFCSTYGSRYKCFQQLQGCHPSCRCINCANPYGPKKAVDKDRQVRKQRKRDDLPATSVEYLERKNEPEKLEDFEVFVFQQIVSGILTQSQEGDTPDYETVSKFFKEVLETAGFITILPFDKVKR